MIEKTLSVTLPQNGESTELKPWRTPMVEELAINQTENGAPPYYDGPDSLSDIES